ncbi:hypothetical protein F4779DRAFT_560656 [Xylariaceae sp. FL0662B]|nr:hypothetical protein F4779DRAFT_560656 [Xylariaceae sp. FL0662B]
MSSKPTSPAPSEVIVDQSKASNITDKPLSEEEPKFLDENHDDHIIDASPRPGSSAAAESPAVSASSQESGEASPVAPAADTSSAPPLPNEPPPAAEDDGWDFHWDPAHQAYFFYNRFTNETTWDNPRVQPTSQQEQPAPSAAVEPPKNERPPAGGYNPAIHGDYDPNAWYAKNNEEDNSENQQSMDPSTAYAAIGSFNRFTGRWQGADQNPDRHNDESKSRRQMSAFFDVDAAANAHDGRSLKAERSGKKPSKAELKQFKEKRRARKEEKRRAWLRD